MKNNLIATLIDLQLSTIIEICSNKEAIFFDMDGTVLNSETLHFRAINQVIDSPSPYTIDDLYGMADIDVYPLLKKFTSHSLDSFLKAKSDLMQKIIPSSSLEEIILPEIITVIKSLKSHGKRLALVTASERTTTHALLRHCGLYDLFDHIVTRQDTKLTKPNPEPYEHALKILNVKKENAIIFEDSPTGIAAALASSIDTVKVEWYAKKNHEE